MHKTIDTHETDALLTESELAPKLSVSVATLRRWRLLRNGPRFVKLGAAVRYRPKDVAAWLDTRPSGGGGSVGL